MKILNNKAALEYFQNAGKVLKTDLELLKSHLGINEFGYLKMFYNNKYFYLSSDSKMIEDFTLSVKDTVIFYDKMLLTQNEYDVILWPKLATNYALELYQQHNHWNGVTFLKKNDDSIDLHWFTSDISNDLAKDFFIKNSNVLVAFLQYWLSKNRERLELDAPKVLANFIDGVDFSNIDKIELDKKDEKDRLKKFLELIRLKGANVRTSMGSVYITPRELTFLHLLAKGYAIKEIANLLNISSRTADTHINNIRTKTGFLRKSDLIKMYQKQIVNIEL